jgi:phosphate transport system permease protein
MKKVSYANKRKGIEEVIKYVLLFCAIISVFTTLAIVISLSVNTVEFFREVSILEFLFGREWTPLFMNPKYGVLPLVAGTFLVTIGAALIALPVGLFSAIYLSEYAPKKVRKVLKPFLEILAGIPSIVYGFFALNYITPILQRLIPRTEIYNAASASIAIGIMIMPIVASLSEDAMRSVPNSLRQGGYALGATQFEVVKGIVLPGALSGIIASFVLAISRAIGETMVVVLAAGARPNLTINPLESVQTLTAFIVQVSQGDLPHGTTSYYALYAVGMLLFLITLSMNILSKYIVNKGRLQS